MAGRNFPMHHLLRPHPTRVGEISALQHRKIQALLVDNQRLAAIHVALKQELAASEQELRRLSAAAEAAKHEGDAHVGAVYEKAKKLEAEMRGLREMEVELLRVREDLRKMEEDRRELVGNLEDVEEEVRNVRAEAGEIERVMDEIQEMRKEVLKGRAAVELEKKKRACNIEVDKIFEKNVVSMAHDFQKLHAEIANAEKMEKAAAAAAAAAASPGPSYAAGYGKSDVGYSAKSYAGPYAAQQGNVGSSSQYRSGSAAHSPYGTQQKHVP